MQLDYYLVDIFEDNHNILRDCFETDSVNVMKNRLLVAKRHMEISMYLAQLDKKTHENCQ